MSTSYYRSKLSNLLLAMENDKEPEKFQIPKKHPENNESGWLLVI